MTICCQECGARFHPTRVYAKFCSVKCRMRAYRRRLAERRNAASVTAKSPETEPATDSGAGAGDVTPVTTPASAAAALLLALDMGSDDAKHAALLDLMALYPPELTGPVLSALEGGDVQGAKQILRTWTKSGE